MTHKQALKIFAESINSLEVADLSFYLAENAVYESIYSEQSFYNKAGILEYLTQKFNTIKLEKLNIRACAAFTKYKKDCLLLLKDDIAIGVFLLDIDGEYITKIGLYDHQKVVDAPFYYTFEYELDSFVFANKEFWRVFANSNQAVVIEQIREITKNNKTFNPSFDLLDEVYSQKQFIASGATVVTLKNDTIATLYFEPETLSYSIDALYPFFMPKSKNLLKIHKVKISQNGLEANLTVHFGDFLLAFYDINFLQDRVFYIKNKELNFFIGAIAYNITYQNADSAYVLKCIPHKNQNEYFFSGQIKFVRKIFMLNQSCFVCKTAILIENSSEFLVDILVPSLFFKSIKKPEVNDFICGSFWLFGKAKPSRLLDIDEITIDDLKDKQKLAAIYADMQKDYYFSKEFCPKLYIELAKAGFVSVSHHHNDTQLLMPEMQTEYALLDFKDLKICTNVKKLLKKGGYSFCINSSPNEVIDSICASYDDSWMDGSYKELILELFKVVHKDFRMFSIELRDGISGNLIAGEIGYLTKGMYVSLSGFSKKEKPYSNYGKLQLVLLAGYLQNLGVRFWNLGQTQMQYKIDLGAKVYTREEFIERLNSNT